MERDHALEACDFHSENLIAAGEHPVLIDLESLFHPQIAPPNPQEEQVTSQAAAEIAKSVMRVGLLPNRIWSSEKSAGIDRSGLGALPDVNQVMECAVLASIHDEITAMPMGYETLVGDMGATLSGGQKQRVLIARALYRKPSILVLDEATSHLDLETEKLVAQTLKVLKLTRIIIAHRPETIAIADRVVLIENGSIINPSSAPVRPASIRLLAISR